MFLLSLFWAWTAWNLYHPWRRHPQWLGIVSFIFGLVVGELPLHVIAAEFVLLVLVVAIGGLEGFGDALALLISVAAWAAIARFFLLAHGAREEMERGIVEALGEDYRQAIPAQRLTVIPDSVDYRQLLNPFAFKVPGVKRHRNITYYSGEDVALKLDIFHHETQPPNAPVLMQIHGGAWLENVGNKDQQALPLMGQLASRGWVCVTVQYRLSPGATFPTHIVDCKRALVWIKQHIAEYGGDPNFITVTGGSAGGHLSALLALSANKPDFQPGFEDQDTAVQAAVPFYGVHDFTNSLQQRKLNGLEPFIAERVLKTTQYENPQLWELASPLFHASEQSPPMLLIHGDADTLVPPEESRALRDTLKQHAGVRVGLAELHLAQHAFDLMYSLRTVHVIYGIERFLSALHEEYLAEKPGEPPVLETTADEAEDEGGNEAL